MAETVILRIDLLEEVILSASAASAGEHQSLDYIPGTALLGVAAAAYQRLEEQGLAWRAFHDGGVRFGNGYPLEDGNATIPVPLSWHRAQRDDGDLVSNLAVAPWDGPGKAERLPAGYVGRAPPSSGDPPDPVPA